MKTLRLDGFRSSNNGLLVSVQLSFSLSSTVGNWSWGGVPKPQFTLENTHDAKIHAEFHVTCARQKPRENFRGCALRIVKFTQRGKVHVTTGEQRRVWRLRMAR